MELSEEDAWIFIMSTIRYSMGRRTYMTSLSQDLFHKYKNLLTEEQIDQVYSEIAREIELCERSGTTLGGQWDHKCWSKFIEGKI